MHLNAQETAEKITPAQRQCILNLTSEWQDKGYDKVQADILWALGDSNLYGNYGEIVDCDYYQRPGVCGCYRHRLTTFGLEVQAAILTMELLA